MSRVPRAIAVLMVEVFRDSKVNMAVKACPIRLHKLRYISILRALQDTEPSRSEKDSVNLGIEFDGDSVDPGGQ